LPAETSSFSILSHLKTSLKRTFSTVRFQTAIFGARCLTATQTVTPTEIRHRSSRDCSL